MADVHIWKRQQAQIWTTAVHRHSDNHQALTTSKFTATNEYEQVADPTIPDPQPLLGQIKIPGRHTISDQTSIRPDTSAHSTELDKFQQQGLELYEYSL